MRRKGRLRDRSVPRPLGQRIVRARPAARRGYPEPSRISSSAADRTPPAARATHSAIPLEPFYGPEHLSGRARDEAPGEPPFTRGIHSTMYRERLWTMRQYAGLGDAETTNRRFRHLIASGQTGLSVAFDLPTQMGLDSDGARARGEVGRVGVAVDSVRDVERLFEGIPLERVSVSMTINAPAPVLLAMLVVAAERRGIDPALLSGTTQNDILKEYVARGTYVFPPRPSLAFAADLVAWCARHLPRWNPISVSGYHLRDAGATAVQEMAFALANARAYVEAVMARGVPVDAFAPRISWIFNTHSHFFEEVAKYRSLRRLWCGLLRERFGAREPGSWMLRTHTQTGGVTLTAQQADNNIVRAAYQALAAALGGVQSLALSCKDEALGIPTEHTQQLALRTQQIIAHETGVADVADPLGGSYYVEWLTDQLERRAAALLEQIEVMGGAVAAIESGWMARAIQAEAVRHQHAVEAGERVIVGVNAYSENGAPYRDPVHHPDAVDERPQLARLASYRRRRDRRRHAAALEALARAAAADLAAPGAGVMPAVIEAVRAKCTLGEIMDTLREVYGSHIPSTEF
jgi:methylmalonyl-CoA mutase, N-terminal domain